MSPKIRIWAPNPEVTPGTHLVMQRLADNMEHIEGLLTKNYTPEADFTPSIKRGSAAIDSSVDYEMHSPPASPHMTDALRNINAGIHAQTGLVGGMRRMLSAMEREQLQREHGLTMKWCANLGNNIEQGK